jgi:hypothetical protein
VRSLVTMATPIDFSALPGLAGAIREQEIDPDRLVDWTGNVPPQYLSAFFRARKPTADIPNLAPAVGGAVGRRVRRGPPGDGALGARARPVPRRRLPQVADQWLDGNGLHGELALARRAADRPAARHAAHVQHPRHARRPHPARGGGADRRRDRVEEFELLELDAGHAGLTTSREAATTTMPRLQEWLTSHNAPKEA